MLKKSPSGHMEIGCGRQELVAKLDAEQQDDGE
jgi:hypothetical protein